jgi:hypothetical protein
MHNIQLFHENCGQLVGCVFNVNLTVGGLVQLVLETHFIVLHGAHVVMEYPRLCWNIKH